MVCDLVGAHFGGAGSAPPAGRAHLSPGEVRLVGVVLLRLLVPFQIPMPNLPTAADLTLEPTSLTQTTIPILPSSYSMEEVEAGQAPNLYLNDQGQVHTANSTGTVKPSADGQRAVFSLVWLSPAQLLLGVWGAGAVILALVLLGSNLRFSAKLRRRRTSLDLDDCPLPVYTVESLPSPCLFGLFRPCIYLTPQLTLDSPTRAHVLAHELTHYRQKDHIWSALRCLALALHWYNPLVCWRWHCPSGMGNSPATRAVKAWEMRNASLTAAL